MRRLFLVLSAVSIFGLLMGACNAPISGAAGLDPTQAPVTEAPVVPDTGTEATPEIVPIDLAGPVMEVGSRYTYVDGTVLDAVPNGPFQMGLKNFANSTEHTVTLGDFWIYSTEVTNQQFAWCVAVGKCDPPESGDNPTFDNYRYVNYPVVGVNYAQAAAYCGFVHGRLPTEAEWEKAARGPDGNLFPWGDAAPNCNLLNHDFCTGKTAKVLSYPDGVSFYGLSDMSGNVSEWVADWFQVEYDVTEAAAIDPKGPLLGDKRSVRSSGFGDGGDSAFSAHRASLAPTGHKPDLGFRCVVDDPTFFAPYCQGLVLYGADISGGPGGPPVIPSSDLCGQGGINPPAYGGCSDTHSYITINPYPIPAGDLVVPPEPQCINGPPDFYTCTGTGDVSIIPPAMDACDFEPPPSAVATCSPGYGPPVDDGLGNITCQGQGPGVNCPDGFELDPLLNCCSAINPGPHEYGYCIGFDQVGSDCYVNPGDPYFPTLVTVHFASPSGDCGDGPCEDNPATPVDECPGDDDDNTCRNPPCNPPPGCNPNSVNYPTCLTGG